MGYVIPIVGWCFVFQGILIYFKRQSKKNIVYPLRGFWFIVIFTLFFSTLLFYFTKNGEPVEVLFIAFIVLGIAGIASWLHGIIEYDETGFIVLNFFCQKKRYEYKDIKYLKRKKKMYKNPINTENLVIIYLPGKKVTIEREYANYFEFMEIMAKDYKKNHKKKIPQK